MLIEQTITLRATIPNDAVINYDARGNAVSFSRNGETIRFQAIVEVETAKGEYVDLTRGEYVEMRGISYDYVGASFEILDEENSAESEPTL